MRFDRIRRFLRGFDLELIGISLCLSAIGIVLLYSASFEGNVRKGYWISQLIYLAIGLILMVVVARVRYKFLDSAAYLIYGLCLASLLIVLLFPRSYGAKRWINLGFISFQPSEFGKIALVLLLSRIIDGRGDEPWGAKETAKLLGVSLLPAFLVFVEPDFGTAFVYGTVFMAMLVLGGARRSHIIALLILALLLSPVVWMAMKDYQRNRIMAFINPSYDPLGEGYNVMQSKIAIGSGMLFGKGFLAGTQGRLNFLPSHHTDFIFSVLGEEWGFLGCCVVLALYVLFLRKALNIISSCEDRCGRLIVGGLSWIIGFQAVMNIGMTVGIIPAVGIPLPFMSRGGSALLMAFISVGIMSNVSVSSRMFRAE
jgi:rod shape determining protein RodA